MPWYWLSGNVALETGLSTFLSLPCLEKKDGDDWPSARLVALRGFVSKSWLDPWGIRTELWEPEEGGFRSTKDDIFSRDDVDWAMGSFVGDAGLRLQALTFCFCP